jgi:hypothetical protein
VETVRNCEEQVVVRPGWPHASPPTETLYVHTFRRGRATWRWTGGLTLLAPQLEGWTLETLQHAVRELLGHLSRGGERQDRATLTFSFSIVARGRSNEYAIVQVDTGGAVGARRGRVVLQRDTGRTAVLSDPMMAALRDLADRSPITIDWRRQ